MTSCRELAERYLTLIEGGPRDHRPDARPTRPSRRALISIGDAPSAFRLERRSAERRPLRTELLTEIQELPDDCVATVGRIYEQKALNQPESAIEEIAHSIEIRLRKQSTVILETNRV
jgi:hypothetical protein